MPTCSNLIPSPEPSWKAAVRRVNPGASERAQALRNPEAAHAKARSPARRALAISPSRGRRAANSAQEGSTAWTTTSAPEGVKRTPPLTAGDRLARERGRGTRRPGTVRASSDSPWRPPAHAMSNCQASTTMQKIPSPSAAPTDRRPAHDATRPARCRRHPAR
jgi:hypothetical protein